MCGIPSSDIETFLGVSGCPNRASWHTYRHRSFLISWENIECQVSVDLFMKNDFSPQIISEGFSKELGISRAVNISAMNQVVSAATYFEQCLMVWSEFHHTLSSEPRFPRSAPCVGFQRLCLIHPEPLAHGKCLICIRPGMVNACSHRAFFFFFRHASLHLKTFPRCSPCLD